MACHPKEMPRPSDLATTLFGSCLYVAQGLLQSMCLRSRMWCRNSSQQDGETSYIYIFQVSTGALVVTSWLSSGCLGAKLSRARYQRSEKFMIRLPCWCLNLIASAIHCFTNRNCNPSSDTNQEHIFRALSVCNAWGLQFNTARRCPAV